MGSPKQRRSNYWVKKSFQSSFSVRFAVLALIEAGLITALFYYVSSGTLTTGYDGSVVRMDQTPRFFLTTFVMIGAIASVAIAAAAMLVFILFSHRIAGPVYHLQKALKEISKGNLTYRVRLRKKDQLGDLADDLNRAADFLDEKISQIQRQAAKQDAKAVKETADSFKTSS